MRFISIILLLFLIIIFQTTILPHLKMAGILPNLILIIIIFFSLTTNWQKSLFSALIGGLLLDFFSGWPFGIFSLSLVMISFIFNPITRFYLFTEINLLVILAAVFLGTFFFDLLVIFLIKFMTLIKLSNLVISFKYGLFYLIPMEILYNLVSALVIFYLLKFIKRPVKKFL